MFDDRVLPSGQSSRQNAVLLEQMRQHLSNLMAATHLLTPVVRESGEGKYDQYLAIMNQSFYRLLRLMNHMEFSQALNEGSPPYHPASLDLAGLCHETAMETEPLAKMAGVSFHYESELTSLITTGDAILLRRMLLGLFSNALRAAGQGGEAGLHVTKQRNRAILTVWDNGPGLSQREELESQNFPEGGMGLGLSIVRNLAALHGGAVMLESRPQKGLRAVVSLPIRPPESEGLRTPPPKWDLSGGFPAVLVELSDLLPYEAFFPDDLE
jgi:signal transduction histidine kinase